jgi:histone-lysine N-methyltransferase SETMAR
MQFVENVQANWQEGYCFIMTQERIEELQSELHEHSPYSTDLAPSGFHLFGPLKSHLGGRRFADDEEVETKVRRQESKDFYAASFDVVVIQWDKCINVGGGYVEK